MTRLVTGIPGVRGQVLEEVPLARYTTYHIGGPARYLVKPSEPGDVAQAMRFARERGMPCIALGLGSNVLVSDSGFPGVVVRLGAGVDRVRREGAIWRVGAGLPTPLLAKRTAAAGLAGAHRFIGVPGTVGGGMFMNAGCHGAQFQDIVVDATVVAMDGTDRVVPHVEIPFRYRSSGLTDCIVVEVTLAFAAADPAELRRERIALLQWRRAGTPFDQPCCGSVFRNPGDEQTAGQLIDAAGLKGFRIGGAQVSPMHANYFVNVDGATADDVHRLIDHVRSTVNARFGIELALEVKFIRR